MKYFVTGGAGFIGSHLVDSLLKKGNVTVYDNLSSGKEEFISHNNENEGFRFVRADLLDKETLTKEMAGHDFVFHMAANPDIRRSATETELDLKQGTIATYNVLEAMRLNKISKIAFASSSVVYGEAKKMPIPEDYGPLFPISHYGASKLACEGLISAFCHMYSMQSWLFRFANVIGERATHGILYDFLMKVKKNPNQLEILGDGNQQKSYLLVTEIVESMLFGVENSKKEVNVYNLASRSSITVKRITELFAEEYKKRSGICLELNYTGGKRGWRGDVPLVLLDPTKIESLGWVSETDSEHAVQNTINYLFDELY
ncbi:GDP-mannose 4,6-dehydratase [Candidatus Woesearchaeota archaeon]|nr:GDP-mannose 4,6-dehydratase [Candidatus Woesearchaeota archaeon]